MKKLFIKLFALVALTTSLYAQGSLYYTTSNVAATNIAPISTGFLLDQIILTSTNNSSSLVYLYDGGLTYVTGAYTNYVTYTTNVVSTYISILGTTNIMTNKVVWNALNPHAAATNNSSPILALAVNPATGNVINYTPTVPIVFARSLTLSNNNAGLNVTIRYHLP